MSGFSGKTAVVTGGASGIGRALVLSLAAEGSRVVVADISQANAQAVAEEVRGAGGSAIAVHCDVCDKDSIARMKAEANAAFGIVTLLFANAGSTSFEPMSTMAENDIDWIIQVNLMGVTHCIKTFLPEMVAARDGHIVATASGSGLLPAWIPYSSPYASSKAGVIGLILNMRHELAEGNIGATVLCPFGVATNMQRDNQSYRPGRFGGPRDAPVQLPGTFFEDAALSFRTPEEVADMTLEAVRQNRPMIVTDPTQRANFIATYHDLVMAAFDDAEAFDAHARKVKQSGP